eukprot:TRINITY_DN12194_c0_g1_i1.p2 TRINITY_DN12194_c0_g1~~TRINITY_DN12194_c0_g1_i1.p2  ORF type:complete len:392 (+),score=118.72 TRINITY_DN12194_c0_g1_i1:71-1177(+)
MSTAYYSDYYDDDYGSYYDEPDDAPPAGGYRERGTPSYYSYSDGASVESGLQRFVLTLRAPQEDLGFDFECDDSAVRVVSTERGGPCHRAGIPVPCLLRRLNGRPADTYDALRAAVREARAQGRLKQTMDVAPAPPPQPPSFSAHLETGELGDCGEAALLRQRTVLPVRQPPEPSLDMVLANRLAQAARQLRAGNITKEQYEAAKSNFVSLLGQAPRLRAGQWAVVQTPHPVRLRAEPRHAAPWAAGAEAVGGPGQGPVQVGRVLRRPTGVWAELRAGCGAPGWLRAEYLRPVRPPRSVPPPTEPSSAGGPAPGARSTGASREVGPLTEQGAATAEQRQWLDAWELLAGGIAPPEFMYPMPLPQVMTC